MITHGQGQSVQAHHRSDECARATWASSLAHCTLVHARAGCPAAMQCKCRCTRHGRVQARAALAERSRAARAWRMLRMNTNVRKSSRIIGSVLPPKRTMASLKRYHGGDSVYSSGLYDDVALDEEAAEALCALASAPAATPPPNDGYLTSAHLASSPATPGPCAMLMSPFKPGRFTNASWMPRSKS